MYLPYIENHGIEYLIRKNIHNLEGINGKVKTIFEDFHVHEITKNNVILHLDEIINKDKINQILEDKEKRDETNIFQNISNSDLCIQHFKKYINESDQNVFKKFLNILHQIYLLKQKKEQKNEDEQSEVENNKIESSNIEPFQKSKRKFTIPYCVLTKFDDPTLYEYNDQTNGDQNSKSNDILSVDEKKKIARKNIHNAINKYCPFLLTETKTVTKLDTVISHGNILSDHITDHLNESDTYEHLNHQINTDPQIQSEHKENDKKPFTIIEVYPNFNCLKIITPPEIFDKLKSNAKKLRSNKNDDFENVILEGLEKLKDISKDKNKQNNHDIKISMEKKNEYHNDINHQKDTHLNLFQDNQLGSCYDSIINDDGKCDNFSNNSVRKKRKINELSNEEKFIPILSNTNNLDSQKADQVSKSEKNIYAEIGIDTTVPIIKEETEKIEMKEENKHNCLKNDNNSYTIPQEKEGRCLSSDNFIDKINKMRGEKRSIKRDKKYLHFNLYKENKDICEILKKLKINLKKNNSDISYCGIKDKRGITIQKFCIQKIKKEDIYKMLINNNNWCNNVYLSNLEYKKNKLSLGYLKGNFFKILIRGVNNNEDEKIKFHNLFEILKNFGFINYYGHQRFGSKKIKNYQIGISILKKNYKQALFLIIENTDLDSEKKKTLMDYLDKVEKEFIQSNDIIHKSENESKNESENKNDRSNVELNEIGPIDPNSGLKPDNDTQILNSNSDKPIKIATIKNEKNFEKKKKKYQKNNDHLNRFLNKKKNEKNIIPNEIEEIINSISNNSHVEKIILGSLKNNHNFKNAFMNIPKDIFSLFIHATQSLIFNILVNIRMNKFGFKIVIGDLVQLSHKGNYGTELKSPDGVNSDYTYDSMSESETNYSDKKLNDSSLNNEIDFDETKIIIITEENISQYNIYDVVLPLPGDKNTLFPSNLIDEYKKVLESFELSFDHFKSDKHLFNASGGYRKIVVKPSNLHSVFIKADLTKKNTIPIIKGDLYNLINHKNDQSEQTYDQQLDQNIVFTNSSLYHDHLIKEIPNYQEMSSIFLTCSLPKSSYITVALMEIIK
ncbi:U2 snRNA/tRNA pseudouridine synthase, putative [Plasmodium yoelii]|uniref:U2 snRNA/tRNA pseudouridine synthase n=3 Tax=Plasmodium yoelii TaxID=5861 RepID=A0AAE9WRH0_PLAYO|nr:U2 snRNA/tRNA pseudouridine synthase, putative [Plasmodium yoelii]WBY55727.1 U2 snRNA/tRNA pseudouridine synthase [Plasmodium yoelii yoelii]CDU16788.1 tRNA pseudouridine synthase D, putative [Plasmodium yoelii]VTZ74402.1 U2 snRNA/tRNA pseudouridine synthase, putative [Plasmodium yoelii]|eukprot:XP_724115.2 U2 snRNA/tRNA pseudouridine synthase, putative [Plasmodium yoelii]